MAFFGFLLISEKVTLRFGLCLKLGEHKDEIYRFHAFCLKLVENCTRGKGLIFVFFIFRQRLAIKVAL